MSFTAPAIQWDALVPIIVVLAAGVVGVLIEAFLPRRVRPAAQVIIALLAILVAFVFVVERWAEVSSNGPISIVGGLVEDAPAVAAQGIILIFGLLSILVIADRTSVGDGAFAAQAADRPGSAQESESLRAGWMTTEVVPLTMFSLGGMMVFPACDDLITTFVALEIVSLPLYVLAATARHRRLLSQEAAMKYFVLGAFASAFYLMGAAFLYGFSGSVAYSSIHNGVAATIGMDWLLLTGVVLVLVGLLFKVAAAPFHAWSPDVYQGAPTPITGFMAAGVKAAAFFTLVRFYYVVAAGLGWDLTPMLWAIAILTMVVGTVLGIVQTDFKRMAAYSSIAHAGFMLISVVALVQNGISSILFYALSYGVAVIGAFAIITLVRESHDGHPGAEATHIDAWKGLGRTHPVLASLMTLFLLSFAGIPLTSGFIGKFQVFAAGVAGGATALVVVAVACSVATAFFYMRLIVLMFFHEPDEMSAVTVESRGTVLVVLILSGAVTLILGISPQVVLNLLNHATTFLP